MRLLAAAFLLISSVQAPPVAAPIFGRVVDAETGVPLSHVLILVSGAGLPIARAAATDSGGRFSVAGLLPGHYSVEARRDGYIRAFANSRRAGATGQPVDTTKPRNEELTIRMWKGAAISGTVTNSRGGPFAMASIRACRATTTVCEESTSTDRQGRYRLFGLAPGSYAIEATPHAPPIVGLTQTPTALEIDAILADLAAGRGRDARVTTQDLRPIDGAIFYYPGRTNPAEAGLITVKAGDDLGGVDFRQADGNSDSFVHGFVRGPSGETLNSDVTLMPDGVSFRAAARASQTLRTTATGEFRFNRVLAGDYVLVARISHKDAHSSPRILNARIRLSVTGNVDNLIVPLADARTIRIDIRATEGATRAIDARDLRLSLVERAPSSGPSAGVLEPMRINAEWTPSGAAIFPAVPQGQYSLAIAETTGTWVVESAVFGSNDILDQPFEVGEDAGMDTLRVTITDRPASLTLAIVLDGSTEDDLSVIVFSSDPTHRLYPSRTVRAIRITDARPVEIRNLPVGTYLVAAVAGVTDEDLSDPTFLESLVGSSTKTTIERGQAQKLTIRIGGGPSR